MRVMSFVIRFMSYYKRLRKKYWAWRYFNNQKSVTVHGPLKVLRRERIILGENVTFNEGVIIDPGDGLVIGDNVVVSSNAMLLGSDLNVKNIERPSRERNHISGTIVVGDNVWLGAGCIILKNCSIGSGSIVGAGAVVTKDIPDYSVAVGNPAKIIKKITR